MKAATIALLGTALLAAGCGGNAPESGVAAGTNAAGALPADPAWTGASRPQQVIAARQQLMTQIEQLMIPVDGLEAGAQADARTLQENGRSIAAMLAAAAHLFPPTTNLFDAESDQPATLALPAIWSNFDSFAALNQAGVDAATALAAAAGPDAQKQAAATLRSTCAACHIAYLRPFQEAQVEASDREFDFDAALGGN